MAIGVVCADGQTLPQSLLKGKLQPVIDRVVYISPNPENAKVGVQGYLQLVSNPFTTVLSIWLPVAAKSIRDASSLRAVALPGTRLTFSARNTLCPAVPT